MKEVAIIVVTYNRLNLLQEEIAALRKQTFSDYQIIVVNNGSTDNTMVWLKEQVDIITISQENLGGAGGFHSGIKYAVESGYKYCWIMDDDVICNPAALEELYAAYQTKPDIGFVCSKVIGTDGCPMNTPDVDIKPTANGYADYSDQISNQMVKVAKATFVSVFFSSKIVCEVGLPYKEYFIWGDDSEYTERISSKYDSYLACKSIVVHKRAIQGNLSFENETNINRLNNYYYFFRNQGYNNFKYGDYMGKRIRIVLRLLKSSLKYLLKADFVRAQILHSAGMNLMTFNPTIEFPRLQTKI